MLLVGDFALPKIAGYRRIVGVFVITVCCGITGIGIFIVEGWRWDKAEKFGLESGLRQVCCGYARLAILGGDSPLAPTSGPGCRTPIRWSTYLLP